MSSEPVLGLKGPPRLKMDGFRLASFRALLFPPYQEPSTVGVLSLRFQGLSRLLFPPS